MEGKSKFKLIVLFLFLVMIIENRELYSQGLFLKENLKNYYFLDTIHIEKPVIVHYEKSGISFWLILPESKVDSIDLHDNSIYLKANNLLIPEIKDCKFSSTDHSEYILNKFICNPEGIVRILIAKEYYINSMSYIRSNIRKSIERIAKKSSYIIVAIPICSCG
ncbi:MAG: hypothetical protein ACNS60_20425 [Candidatus Cyclobacteriaceae bacterium M2_1C_046]